MAFFALRDLELVEWVCGQRKNPCTAGIKVRIISISLWFSFSVDCIGCCGQRRRLGFPKSSYQQSRLAPRCRLISKTSALKYRQRFFNKDTFIIRSCRAWTRAEDDSGEALLCFTENLVSHKNSFLNPRLYYEVFLWYELEILLN